MRKLMMTSALVVPFLAWPAFAQEAPAAGTEEPVQQDQPAAGQQPAEPPAGGAETAAQPPAEGEPATDTAAQPPAEGDPATDTAAQPPAEGEPATDTAAQPPAEGEPATDTAAQPPAEGEPATDTAAQPPAEGEPATDTAAQPPAEGEPADVDVVEEPAPEGEEADVEMVDEPAAEGEDAMAEEGTEPAPDAVVTEQSSNELRGDWVIGTGVVSPEGETIGNIEDIILEAEQGQVTAAILSVGGFLGLGAKNIAVDWNELQIDYDGQEITMDLTREQAEQAPEYAFRDQAEAPAPAAPAGGDPAAAPGAVTTPPAQPSQ